LFFFATCTSKPTLEGKLADISTKVNEKSSDSQRLEEEVAELQNRARAIMGERQRVEKDIGNLRDPQQIFKKKLVEKNMPDVKRAMEWLEENRPRLRGECYGPAGAYVSDNSPYCASCFFS
jgi:chromosome segregation ATPase